MGTGQLIALPVSPACNELIASMIVEVVLMATLTIRGLDDQVKADLRLRAARNGRSMEAEVREILTHAVAPVSRAGLGRRLRDRFRGLEADLDIPPRSDVGRPVPDFAGRTDAAQ